MRTVSADPTLPNYDIRDDANEKGTSAVDAILKYRQGSGRSAAMIADVRESFARAEDSLRARIPTLKVEYNQDIRIPEVIGPDVWQGRNFLTGATKAAGEKHADVLINFLKDNAQLVGATQDQVSQLRVAADYTNPNGVLSFVELDQEINGIPVFRGEIKAGFTKAGEMIRVTNNFAPGLDYTNVATDFGNPTDAVKMAANNIKWTLKETDTVPNAAASSDKFVRFGNGGDWDVTAEKMYFPTEPGVAVPAWRVLIWEPVSAYYVIVDANSGTVLWRKNITNDQTQSATYNAYSAAANGSISLSLSSPAPGNPIPGTIDPTIPTPFQAPLLTRTNVTLIGNEGALSFNNLGWMTDGTNGTDGFTDGNAVQTGLDIDGTNGVDAPQNGTARVFNFTWTPSNVTAGIEGGVAANDPTARSGAVTNLFYLNNRYHDALYQVGFTEAARNFQNSNFGRGGAEADRVSGEAQDSSGTNNANFATPADGGRGRMQMFVFTNGTAPSRDGDLDADVVFHEHTHGTSNRLIGNGSGLTSNRAGSSGEGWGDLYGFLLLNKTGDTTSGVYSAGGYVTYKCCGLATFTQNYYYGIRRHPYSPMANVGGPSNKPYNPFTLVDVQTNTHGTSDGAFACSPLIGCSGTASEVHNAGEIWAVTGVEVWAKFVTRLGQAAGTQKTLQLYTDGMKLSPLNPTYIQSRDSIIAAAAASPLTPEASADVADVREGFRIRGMGFSATDTGTSVVEAFDTPNVRASNPITVSDATGDNDGFPEPGESVLVSIPVINPNTGAAITNVQVNINGGTNVAYGTINDGATVTNQIPLTIPNNTTCGAIYQITINITSSAGTQTPFNFSFRVGAPVGGAPITFSNSTNIAINDNLPATPYPSNITVSGLTGNKTVKVTITGITHTFPADLDFLLVSPAGQKYIILSDSGGGGDVSNVNLTLSDGAAAQPSTTQWVTGEFRPYNTGANDLFAAPAPAGPYANAAPAGADTIASVFGTSGAAMNGTWSLYVVDDANIDTGSISGGWSLRFEANDFVCSIGNKTPFDFDGDHKTDISIYRPGGNAEWWYSRSSDNQVVAGVFGGTGDIPTPGDFTGDGKTDIAFYRPGVASQFFILRSEDNTFLAFPWGTNGDIPTPADFDGDGKTDAAIFRPSSGTWFILPSGGGAAIIAQFGTNGDQPVAADYDNDGKADIGIVRTNGANKEWWIQRSTAGLIATVFGQPADKATPGDFTGDGKADIAFFRPSTGQWFILRSEDLTFLAFGFGQTGDIPVPGDYDGDGKFDAAVFRPTGAIWFINRTGGSGVLIAAFGAATDTPVPNAYVR